MKFFLPIAVFFLFPQWSAANESIDHFQKKRNADLQSHIAIKKAIKKEIEWELASVKSKSELINYASIKSTPLNKLSPSSKQRFFDGISFNDKGVTEIYYKDLELELTKSEIYTVLSTMGAQYLMPLFKKAREETEADRLIDAYYYDPIGDDVNKDFLMGYKCAGLGTCRVEKNRACTKNC